MKKNGSTLPVQNYRLRILGTTALLAIAMTSCGGGASGTGSPPPPPPPPPPVSVVVAISPKTISLPLGGFQAFSATVTGSTNTKVSWSIQESSSAGSVDSAGLFVASHTAGTYHVVATSVANPADSASATVTVSGISVDDFIATCPTKDEVDTFNSALAISFESDPTAPTLVCTAAAGSADLTRLQERAFQAMRVIKVLQYDAPLPWTDMPLYDWFTSIKGIRFRGDIQTSFCCDPAGVINIQTVNATALNTTRWVDPNLNSGLDGMVNLLIHEARHVYSGPHTCGGNDQTISELNGWGVQYYSEEWMAFHSGTFLMPTASAPSSSYYKDTEWRDAQALRDTRFCNDPAFFFSPTALTFGPQQINTTSPAQAIALTSGTSGTVSVSGVHIAGGTTDFNLQSSTCSNASVSPSCVAVITFKPATPGTKSASLVVDGPAGPLLSVLLNGYGGVAVAVSPASMSMYESDSQTFTASVLGTSNTAVAWSVVEWGAGGSISPAGVYTAPKITAGGTFHVAATSVADPSQSAIAQVTVAPVVVDVDPSLPSTVFMTGTLQFSATVEAGAAHQAVNWSVSEGISGGSITSTGLYTAPGSPGTYHVVATSSAFTSIATTIPITVPDVSVAVSPNGDTLGEHVTRQFSAAVTSVNPAVTWTTDDPSGNVDTTGFYTAGSTPGAYHVRATTNADPAKFAEVPVNVTRHGFRYTTGALAGLHTAGTSTLLDCTAQGITGCGTLDGHVLVAGDYLTNTTVEGYDPSTDSFAQIGTLPKARSNHGAILLNNGKVLIAGGEVQLPGDPGTDHSTETALLFDPVSRSFTATGSMTTPRVAPSVTVLKDGTVLVAGGWNSSVLNTAEIYDPSTGTFHLTNGPMIAFRGGETATRLQDGRVLFIGGADSSTNAQSTAEIYDPATGTFRSTAGSMAAARTSHSATLLGDGKVLVVGGYDANYNALNSVEVYDPATDQFSPRGQLPSPVYSHGANLLADGTVLISGGCDMSNQECIPLSDAFLFNPVTGTATSTGSLRTPHSFPAAVLLPGGTSVLVVGGEDYYGFNATEVYQ